MNEHSGYGQPEALRSSARHRNAAFLSAIIAGEWDEARGLADLEITTEDAQVSHGGWGYRRVLCREILERFGADPDKDDDDDAPVKTGRNAPRGGRLGRAAAALG